jgi:hypothetical protein
MSLIADGVDSFEIDPTGWASSYAWGFFFYVSSTDSRELTRPAGSGARLYIWDGVFNLYSTAYFDIYTTLPAVIGNWYFVGYSVESDVNVTFFASLLGSNTVEYVTTTTGGAMGQEFISFSNGHFGCIKHWRQALSNAQIQQEATQIRCFADPYIWIPMIDYTSLAGQGRNLRGAGNSIGFTTGSISTLSPPIPLGVPLVPYAPQLVAPPPPPPYFASPLGMLMSNF